jgi:hypothetical protein
MARHRSSRSRGAGFLIAIENLYKQVIACAISFKRSSNSVVLDTSSGSDSDDDNSYSDEVLERGSTVVMVRGLWPEAIMRAKSLSVINQQLGFIIEPYPLLKHYSKN